jgi:hypothetical protein
MALWLIANSANRPKSLSYAEKIDARPVALVLFIALPV